MTDPTTHAYTATAGYRPVEITAGDLTLSSAGAPHVTGNLTIALPSTSSLAGYDVGVQLIPGGGLGGVTPNVQRRVQYVVDSTDPNDGDVRKLWDDATLNDQHTPGRANMRVSIDRLDDTLPKGKRISLVVGWFLDPTARTCRPMVEQHEYANTNSYESGGVTYTRNVRGNIVISQAQYDEKVTGGRVRDGVELVDEWEVAGLTRNEAGYLNVEYGETPSDQDVVDTIRYLTGRGYEVDLYPFLFGYAPDKPWRGRLTLNTPAEMAEFLGGEWGYRRFIRHYIDLVHDNNLDVHTFFVGSEMRGATYSLPAEGYPFVDELIALAAYARAELPGVAITYAADWSEYHSDPADYTARPLDRLWASPAIDHVSIDAYFPLTSAHTIDYDTIRAGWTSGEAYDYWVDYDDPATPHYDLSPDNAIKNLGHWWSTTHTDRGATSAWVPESKPIFFSEIGFATVNGTTNQPNVFVDPSSSESAYPRGSDHTIDYEVQLVALRATLDWLADQPWAMRTPAHIWCWDTRPYPTFPDPDVWSDSGNYVTGHWIDGKVNETALDALDPRTGNRLRITATRRGDGSTQTRTFDVGIRERRIDHAASTLPVRVASDEALLDDYRPLTDDEQPYWIFIWGDMSIRTLVEHVLDQALGAELSPASVGAIVPMSWSTRNVIPNPRLTASRSHWVAIDASSGRLTGTVALAPYQDITWSPGAYLRTTSTAENWAVSIRDSDDGYFDVNGGEWWSAAAYVNGSSGVTARCVLVWRDAKGRTLSSTAGDWIQAPSGWRPVRAWAVAPPEARQVDMQIQYRGAVGNTGRATAAVLTQDRMPSRYFDGDQGDNDYDTFAWSGDPYESASTRTATTETGRPETVVWPAGTSALDYLMPIVQRAGLRLVCNEQRVWTLRNDSWGGGTALDLTVDEIVEGGDTISRDDDSWFDAAVTTYTWEIAGSTYTRTDSYALTDPPTKVRHFERDMPWPGAGFSRYAVQRAQGRGRAVEATTIADWDTRAEQAVTLRLPGSTYRGKIAAVTFSLDRDEMTITARDTDT